jgi:hypothetical protein
MTQLRPDWMQVEETARPKKKYTFISDPGHGWLRVPIAECKGLDISSYSFRDSKWAYLEEDRDAPLFMRARGVTHADIEEQYVNCFARNRRRF